jgi:rhodanese-related sulfurtransferase
MNYRDIDPDEAHAELKDSEQIRLLDVRTQPEHASHRLPNATLIPVQELAQRTQELDQDQKWFVYCEHGIRSIAACGILTSAGFENVTNIRGGIARWAQQSLPYDSGR